MLLNLPVLILHWQIHAQLTETEGGVGGGGQGRVWGGGVGVGVSRNTHALKNHEQHAGTKLEQRQQKGGPAQSASPFYTLSTSVTAPQKHHVFW